MFWQKLKFNQSLNAYLRRTGFRSRPCENSLANYCTSKSSKNKPPLSLNKADGQAFRSVEVQKSARNFSHGLDFSPFGIWGFRKEKVRKKPMY